MKMVSRVGQVDRWVRCCRAFIMHHEYATAPQACRFGVQSCPASVDARMHELGFCAWTVG